MSHHDETVWAVQPEFDLTEPNDNKPWKRVRDTSKAVYAIGRETFEGRKAAALRLLAAFWNRHNYSPTSAELAAWSYPAQACRDCHQLWIRRGLSDLHRTGIVEHVPGEVAPCRITGRNVERWRVREMGSQESR